MILMSEQQSQKQGLRSSAQKEERARDAYAPLPASNEVGGAFGEAQPARQSDEDLSLSKSAHRNRQERDKR
jgi:hypothetical protein